MTFRGFVCLLATCILTIFITACHKTEVDYIIKNSKIYTIDSTFSVAEAMAVKDGKIVAIGKNSDITRNFSSKNVLELPESCIYPGFIDGHSHFLALGEMLYRYADLSNCSSFSEVIDSLKSLNQNSQWIMGRGWNEKEWFDSNLSYNELLDKYFPDKFVVLSRSDGHAGIVNSNVLKKVNYSVKTKIDGGKIYTNDSGKLTGLVTDNAYFNILKEIPELESEDFLRALQIAQSKCLQNGLTTVTDAGLDYTTIEQIQNNSNALKIRLNIMMNPTQENKEAFIDNKYVSDNEDFITINSIKLYIDGALGSRGALLKNEYCDDKGNFGLKAISDSTMDFWCGIAVEHGLQICAHAIGDSAVKIALNEYAKFLPENNDLRWRIEHSQIIDENDLKSFKTYNIIPSIQATHAISDMFWAKSRLGDNLKNAYRYKTLLETNGWIINGTDFPLDEMSPLNSYFTAVFRQNRDLQPTDSFMKDEALSREDALKSITIWPAKGMFVEKQRGSLEIGKVADFVILDTDLMTASAEEILKAKINSVFINGKKVYENSTK